MSIVLFQYNFNYEIGGKTDLSCGLNLVTPDTEYIKKKKIEKINSLELALSKKLIKLWSRKKREYNIRIEREFIFTNFKELQR